METACPLGPTPGAPSHTPSPALLHHPSIPPPSPSLATGTTQVPPAKRTTFVDFDPTLGDFVAQERLGLDSRVLVRYRMADGVGRVRSGDYRTAVGEPPVVPCGEYRSVEGAEAVIGDDE